MNDIAVAQHGGVDVDAVEQHAVVAVIVNHHEIGAAQAQEKMVAGGFLGSQADMGVRAAADDQFVLVEGDLRDGAIAFDLFEDMAAGDAFPAQRRHGNTRPGPVGFEAFSYLVGFTIHGRNSTGTRPLCKVFSTRFSMRLGRPVVREEKRAPLMRS